MKTIYLTLILFTSFIYSSFASTFGTITDVKGKAKLIRYLRSYVITKGMVIKFNDHIHTSGNSSIKMKLGNDKNIITIAPNTKVMFRHGMKEKSKENKKSVFLFDGLVRCSLNDLKTKDFMVKTPTAVAGVRGTDFVVSYSLKNRGDTKVKELTD